MNHTPLRARIQAIHDREASLRSALDPVIEELTECGIVCRWRGTSIVIPRGEKSDPIIIRALPDGFYLWGLTCFTPDSRCCLDDLLRQIAEYLA